MDPYEIGKVYHFDDGGPSARYKGGDPSNPGSWEEQGWADRDRTAPNKMGWADRDTLAPEPQKADVPPPNYLPAFANDAPTYTPEQAKRAAQASLAVGSLAIPGLGAVGNIAAQGGVGAAIGALGAEPGDRMRAATTGFGVGAVGGSVAEGGAGLISKLTAPGKLLALKNVAPELRALLESKGQAMAEGTKKAVGNIDELLGYRMDWLKDRFGGLSTNAEKESAAAVSNTGGLFDDRLARLNELHDALGTDVIDRATKANEIATGTAGPRVAGRIRETTGITDPIDVANTKTRGKLGEVSEQQYQNLDQVIHDDELIALMSSPEFRRDATAVGYKDGPPTLQQFQDFRNRFRGPGNNQDRQLYARVNAMGQRAIEGLPEADKAYAQLSGTLRERKLGQKAGAQPASTLREHVAGLAERPEQVVAFREGRAADLLQRLEQKGTGAPVMQSLLDGGPEMDARLAAVFPDHVSEIKQIIAEEKAALAQTTKSSNIEVAKLGNQRKTLTDLLTGEKQSALEGLGRKREGDMAAIAHQRGSLEHILTSNRDAAVDRLHSRADNAKAGLSDIEQRVKNIEANRQALQESAQRTAARIRNIFKVGGVVGGAYELSKVARGG